MAISSDSEPVYGLRLMPLLLDELARTQPNRVYAAIPKSSDVTQGFRDVTIADIARCVNYTARWIETQLGKSISFETISYIGISDVRGPIVFLAAVKCGYKVQFSLKTKRAYANIFHIFYFSRLVTRRLPTCSR